MTAVLYPGATVDWLTPERVRAGLPTRYLGHELLHFSQTASTNDAMRAKAQQGAQEGWLALTEEQIAGRGRRGRRWQAPFGSSLLCSLLLRPTFVAPEQAFLLTALATLALSEAISGQSELRPEIKWPNDLMLGRRKLCGILIELEGRPERLEWAVIGWGLNVNVDFGPDPDLSDCATSLAMALGRPQPRLPLLWACLARLEHYYDWLRSGGEQQIWSTWRSRLHTLGRMVRVDAPEGVFWGRALDVNNSGALLVRREDGVTVPVLAGEVSVRLPCTDGTAP
ncbi:MAG: biotin--[acetyl-CoA-carboxylase] ligase [Chloroflexia bacterium]|nr:biotin--[acetyl-CoA-carboxylase] ligase [Chloroflexia bacterium]